MVYFGVKSNNTDRNWHLIPFVPGRRVRRRIVLCEGLRASSIILQSVYIASGGNAVVIFTFSELREPSPMDLGMAITEAAPGAQGRAMSYMERVHQGGGAM